MINASAHLTVKLCLQYSLTLTTAIYFEILEEVACCILKKATEKCPNLHSFLSSVKRKIRLCEKMTLNTEQYKSVGSNVVWAPTFF